MADSRSTQRRIRSLLRLAGDDPATADPERQAAHAKAEALAGEPLGWQDLHDHSRLISSIDEILDHVGAR